MTLLSQIGWETSGDLCQLAYENYRWRFNTLRPDLGLTLASPQDESLGASGFMLPDLNARQNRLGDVLAREGSLAVRYCESDEFRIETNLIFRVWTNDDRSIAPANHWTAIELVLSMQTSTLNAMPLTQMTVNFSKPIESVTLIPGMDQLQSIESNDDSTRAVIRTHNQLHLLMPFSGDQRQLHCVNNADGFLWRSQLRVTPLEKGVIRRLRFLWAIGAAHSDPQPLIEQFERSRLPLETW